jgi:N-6 DNA Methylase
LCSARLLRKSIERFWILLQWPNLADEVSRSAPCGSGPSSKFRVECSGIGVPPFRRRRILVPRRPRRDSLWNTLAGTPQCVVQVLVAMLEPYEGRVFDPCCGSGGMFVSPEKFVEEHGG